MEEIKATEVEKIYMIHWSCPYCDLPNTHESESPKNIETVECWGCEKQINLEWEY